MLIKLNILQDQRGSFFVNHANYSNIDSKYVWMIDRWLFELENIGLIRKIDDTYIINEHLKMNNLEIEWEKLFDMWKNEYGNINLLKYIKINSDNILDIAKGNIDPVKLLYPDSSNRYTEALYRFNSSSKLINDYFINMHSNLSYIYNLIASHLEDNSLLMQIVFQKNKASINFDFCQV